LRSFPGVQQNVTLLICGLIILLGGCNAAKVEPTVIQPTPQPMTFQEPPPTYSNPGSIFDAANANYLFADSRAKRVGDIVTVHIVESSQGSSSANTNTSRNSSSSYNIGSLFFNPGGDVLGLFNTNPLLTTSTGNQFNGQGTTSRTNNVTATVAARVYNVQPNGLLEIEGIRETKVNNETQYLVVRGLIRSRDIAADNSILSTQIADAHIAYYGQGVINDRQKPGWLTRLLDTIWPI